MSYHPISDSASTVQPFPTGVDPTKPLTSSVSPSRLLLLAALGGAAWFFFFKRKR